MSIPAPGDYLIINRVTSHSGNSLALNYDGNSSVVNVVDLQMLPTQVWTISNYNLNSETMQCISPVISSELQIGMGQGVLEVLSAGNYTWYVVGVEDVYVMQDGAHSYFWGLEDAAEGTPVSFGIGTGDEKQNWQLIPVSG